MGADRQLADLKEIEAYFAKVDAASDRVQSVDIGPTTDGHRLFGAIISAPDNIRNLPAIKSANQRLADPRSLSPADAAELAATQKAILAIGCSIHATEIGATQAANELLFTLATATDARTESILQSTVIILIPSLNPDGHTLVVDWYRKTKDTPFEGAPMPWLYHKYVGHDINRDAFMLNMAENRSMTRFFYTEWHPQVFLTMHEMGQRGPRFFVPPNYDPIDTNYDPLIWREAGLLGHAMGLALEEDNRSGVVSNAMFDYYWPGYEDSAPLGHNTVCLLTEVASVRLASPISIAGDEIMGASRGLPENRAQLNFPNPWPGGAWRLRDIVEYDLTAVQGLLEAVSRYREELIANFYAMGRRAVETGKNGAPFAFIIPPEQHDPGAAAKLANLLIDARVEVHRALEPFRADGDPYPAGTDIIFMAQPYKAYAKTLLERQNYPARRASPGASPDRPYDVTGWTLPYQMGVNVRTIERTFEAPAMSRLDRADVEPEKVWGERKPSFYLIDARGNGGAIAANRVLKAGLQTSWLTAPIEVGGYNYPTGSLVVRSGKAAPAVAETIARELGLRVAAEKGKMPAMTMPLKPVRLGLYKPWVENIDEGWTRWLLEQHEFPFRTLRDADVRRGNLRAELDAIILPDASPDRLIAGHASGSMPPEYTGGLGEEGVEALRAFVQAGGTLICLDSSGGLAIEALHLPIRDVTRDARADQFFCPGSILRLDVDTSLPLGYGMQPQTSAFFAYSAAYDVSPTTTTAEGHGGSAQSPSVQIVGRYPPRDLLMSGWLQGEPVIADRAAVVEARSGLGRAVLIGFRAQHRAQSHATFRLLFNAVLTSRTTEAQ